MAYFIIKDNCVGKVIESDDGYYITLDDKEKEKTYTIDESLSYEENTSNVLYFKDYLEAVLECEQSFNMYVHMKEIAKRHES